MYYILKIFNDVLSNGKGTLQRRTGVLKIWCSQHKWNNRHFNRHRELKCSTIICKERINLLKIVYNMKCRSQWPLGLKPLASWDCRFESRRGHGCSLCVECCVLSGRGLCDGLITRPEKSYRLWCVVVCDLETSRMRRTWSALDRSGRCVRLRTYHHPVPLSRNLGTLTSWNPLGLSRLVMGLLSLYHILYYIQNSTLSISIVLLCNNVIIKVINFFFLIT